MKQGEAIAWWLRERLNASTAYDVKYLYELAAFDIQYFEAEGTLPSRIENWARSEPYAELPVYSPAALIQHPFMEFHNIDGQIERFFFAYELSDAIHRVLWPMETPPGNALIHGPDSAFDKNVASIEQYAGRPGTTGRPQNWTPADYTYVHKEPDTDGTKRKRQAARR